MRTVPEPPRRGKFVSTCSRLSLPAQITCICLTTGLCDLISMNSLVANSMSSGTKLPEFKSRLHSSEMCDLGQVTQSVYTSISLFERCGEDEINHYGSNKALRIMPSTKECSRNIILIPTTPPDDCQKQRNPMIQKPLSLGKQLGLWLPR